MGIDLIDRDLVLPALMAGADEIQRQTLLWIQERGNQPVALTIAGPSWTVKGILDDTDRHVLTVSTTSVIRGMDAGQIGAICKRL